MQAVGNKIFAEVIEKESTLITLDKPNKALVISVGQAVKHIKKGMTIQFYRESGTPYKHENKNCIFLKESDIEVILS